MKNVLFIIDEIEFKYFEFNVLVTDFWMIKTFIEEGYKVDITTKHELFWKETNRLRLFIQQMLKAMIFLNRKIELKIV